ncbi:MAG: rod shape-determining protein RodA [Firmicutes bacterium]|nr:rod shape-determining protein RodA [Bacillota bacterium]
MRTRRRVIKDIDWSLVAAVLILTGVSLPMIASATQATTTGDYSLVVRQAVAAGLGVIAVCVVLLVDYTDLMRFSRLIYAGNLGLLVAVLLRGRSALGAQRWLQLGPIPLQPSEVAKIAVIVTLASVLARREDESESLWGVFWTFAHIALPMALVLKQPDLGTSLVFLAVAFGMLLVSGAKFGYLATVFGGGLASAVGAIVAHFRWGLPLPLKEYQLKRLIIFTNPGIDPLGAGYHIRQSIIAVGSGRLFGKGLFAGTQNQLRFLPFQHTDFIFSVIGEELGYVGGVAILLVYLFVIWRGLRIAASARDSYGALLATGVVSVFAFHIIVNVGMTIGVMPVTGIPLPFMSYGGTSLVTNMVGVGILLNVYMRRHRILF